MSQPMFPNELIDLAKLDTKRRGELAELAFMRKAVQLGFAVAKPWGDSERYDVVLRLGKTFLRVQVKSVLGPPCERKHYRINTRDSQEHTYGPEDIEFLAGYIFAEDLFYIFPASVVEHRTVICARPGSKKSWVERYRDAWSLLRESPELLACHLPGPMPPPGGSHAQAGKTLTQN